MDLLRYTLFIIFFLLGQQLSAQDTDEKLLKEIEALHQLRKSDSLKMLSLINEVRQLKAPKTIPTDTTKHPEGVPVLFKGDTLYKLYYPLGPFDVASRAKYIETKLDILYNKPLFYTDSLKIKNQNDFYSIFYEEHFINSISSLDALSENSSPEELAIIHLEKMRESINHHRAENGLKITFTRTYELLLIIGVIVGMIWFINRLFRFLKHLLLKNKNRFLRSIKIRKYELIKQSHIIQVIDKVLSLLKIFLLLVLFVTATPLIFRLFPSTKNWSDTITDWLWNPAKSIWDAIVGYLPNLITIGIILLIVRYILKLLRFFALEIERKALTIKGFYPEWAKTTYYLIRFVLLTLSLVVIFPYLPGSDSDAFKGVSVFLGILISIGSSSAVANAVAGLVITYMRPFKPGDWIKVGEHIGVVIEKDALVTRIKTFNNEDITLPNSTILSGATVNFSSLGQSNGLALGIRLKVKYDYSQNLIEELLISAALRTQDVTNTPCPYVLQISLEEFYSVYELNAYTFKPENMFFIKSDLIKNIQNAFRQSNIDLYTTQYVEIKGITKDKL